MTPLDIEALQREPYRAREAYAAYRSFCKRPTSERLLRAWRLTLPLVSVVYHASEPKRERRDLNRADNIIGDMGWELYRTLAGIGPRDLDSSRRYTGYYKQALYYGYLRAVHTYCEGVLSPLVGEWWDLWPRCSREGLTSQVDDRLYLEELPGLLAKHVFAAAGKRGGEEFQRAVRYVFRRFMKGKPAVGRIIRDRWGQNPRFVIDWTVYQVRVLLWRERERSSPVPEVRSDRFFYIR